VRCAHGATIGQLDEAQVFYLESRGLDPGTAEALLARGFAGEVINLVRNEAVRKELAEIAENWFENA